MKLKMADCPVAGHPIRCSGGELCEKLESYAPETVKDEICEKLHEQVAKTVELLKNAKRPVTAGQGIERNNGKEA